MRRPQTWIPEIEYYQKMSSHAQKSRDLVVETLRNNNYQLHFSYYQFTGEEAPMPLDDIESDDEDEDEDEDDEEDEEPDFLNYWTDPPIPTHRGPALD